MYTHKETPIPKITPTPLSLDRPTLRAILAGMAMQGQIDPPKSDSLDTMYGHQIISNSVMMADRLLSELDRTQEPRT